MAITFTCSEISRFGHDVKTIADWVDWSLVVVVPRDQVSRENVTRAVQRIKAVSEKLFKAETEPLHLKHQSGRDAQSRKEK